MNEWKKNNEKVYGVSLTKSDPLCVALERAADYEQIKPVQYIKLALVDKLTKDGFLTDYVTLRGPGRRPHKP